MKEMFRKLFGSFGSRTTKPQSLQLDVGVAALPSKNLISIASFLPTQNASCFASLPSEIIYSVASFLAFENASCLALCNRRLSQLLGPAYFKSLRNDETTMANFLRILEKDLPRHWACFDCYHFHQIARVPWPNSIRRGWHRCIFKGLSLTYCDASSYRMRLPYVQLAMNRHEYGAPHGIPLGAFDTTQVLVDNYRRLVTFLLSVEAKIISREFLTRSQLWILVPPENREDLIMTNHLHHLCCHEWFVDYLEPRPNNIQNMITSLLEELSNTGSYSSHVKSCPRCHMDFRLEALDFGVKGVALVLTRWHNFGHGADEADVKWNSHIEASKQSSTYLHEPHVLGSIRETFEKEGSMKERDLAAMNSMKLFSERKEGAAMPDLDGYKWVRNIKWPKQTEWHLVSRKG